MTASPKRAVTASLHTEKVCIFVLFIVLFISFLVLSFAFTLLAFQSSHKEWSPPALEEVTGQQFSSSPNHPCLAPPVGVGPGL